jgi:uncharacterized protein
VYAISFSFGDQPKSPGPRAVAIRRARLPSARMTINDHTCAPSVYRQNAIRSPRGEICGYLSVNRGACAAPAIVATASATTTRVPAVDADPVEIRVLGCLIEKQRTTPDQYPLSLNSIRLACNQATNRDPVVDYDETTVLHAVRRLSEKGWIRLASGPGSRASKYRQLFDEALHLDDAEISLLAVLMLRGPQTPGELKSRTERLHRFGSVPELEETLERLIDREYVARVPRRPGQKEERYAQLVGGDAEEAPAVPREAVSSPLEERVSRLEAEVAAIRGLLEARGLEELPAGGVPSGDPD